LKRSALIALAFLAANHVSAAADGPVFLTHGTGFAGFAAGLSRDGRRMAFAAIGEGFRAATRVAIMSLETP
jgi:hypothetical protein